MTGNYSPYNRAPLWSGSDTPYDKEAPLYKVAATLNKLRNQAISIDSKYVTEHSTELYLDSATMATRKGPDAVQIVSVFSNQGEKGGKYDLSVGPDAYKEGTEVIEVFTCKKSRANEGGNVTAAMESGEPRAFFPTSHMDGTGLCGYKADKASGTGSAAQPTKTGAAVALSGRWEGVLALSVAAVMFWLL